MSMMRHLSNITRPKGDPKITSTGPSSLTTVDKIARGLGWFSLGLGLLELLAPRQVTEALGMEGSEGLIRAYGVREIGAGVVSLSVDKQVGLWSRVGGDGLDVATLLAGLRRDNPRQHNVATALLLVTGITILDLIVAQRVSARHARRGGVRLYQDRSGFPKGTQASKGAARDFQGLRETRAPAL